VSQEIQNHPFLFPLSCILQKTLLSLVFYNFLLKTSGSPCLQYRNPSLSSLLYKNLTSKLLLFAPRSLEFTLESVAEAMILRDSLMFQKLRHLSLLWILPSSGPSALILSTTARGFRRAPRMVNFTTEFLRKAKLMASHLALAQLYVWAG